MGEASFLSIMFDTKDLAGTTSLTHFLGNWSPLILQAGLAAVTLYGILEFLTSRELFLHLSAQYRNARIS